MINKRFLSIVIPCYNEKNRISKTLSELLAFHKNKSDIISEVILVDDGSYDYNSFMESVMYFHGKLPLVVESLPENKGKWAAIRHGIGLSENDCVLLLDADHSASIFELDKLDLNKLVFDKIAVFGTRFNKSSEVVGKSFVRSVVSRIYRFYVLFWYWFATGKRDIDDMQAPWKLIHKSKLFGELSVDRFAGDFELACVNGSVILNHPLCFVHEAGSKIRISSAFQMFFEVFMVGFKYRFNMRSKTYV